ncbi:hypothetical protein [Mycobacterium sp. 1274756.6]|uniref:hypothetical protein n=1 Tax=Mycobacterium sp. 1274756.6 TaxID=1834076 RepID=UPI0007FE93F2|nr:hypothetical protein [Mycobacterium sp. 1274756.6]OBJ71459.1 hypothetical protein A5643_07885 [Mycobacterium sp. 1274756.6]
MTTPNIPPPEQSLLEALMNIRHNGVLSYIDERGQRCGDLYEWGLHPHTADEGSALAADDAAFAAAYPITLPGLAAVTGHALFPVIAAVGNLNTVGILVARRLTHQQPHILEVINLCRVALESAALTVWLLRDPDPDIRLARCLAEEMEQMEQQRRFLVIDAENEAGRRERFTQERRTMNAEHRRKFNLMLSAAKDAYSFDNPPSFTTMVRESAQWADAHMPDTEEIDVGWRERSARSLYSYGSSFIHGYRWMTDYSRDGTVWSLLADAMGVALNMTECAVCLYETASRAPGGARPEGSYVPERLEPTIAAWSAELFSS